MKTLQKDLNQGFSHHPYMQSAHLRGALPRWSPQIAGLGQMLTLLQLLLPDDASNQGVAVLVHAMPEVLAGNTFHIRPVKRY